MSQILRVEAAKGLAMHKTLILIGLLLAATSQAEEVKLLRKTRSAEPSQSVHLISPYIYGFGSYLQEDRSKENVFELKPTLYRFGGNTSSRYNYLNNSWNSAQDWFFHNYTGGQSSLVESFMKENRARGIASAITVPMLGWVAKDGKSFSYPRAKFPKQDGFEGEAGNGKSEGKNLQADPKDTSIPITPDFVFRYVTRLKTQFGPHPHFYIMDNEPMLWNQTHRDVQPEPMSYDSYLKRYIDFALAVRKADPEAIIVGPASWGWMEIQYSAFDIEGPWNGWKKGSDRKAHGDKPFLEWFLEEIVKEEAKRKVSLLDIIDVHYYPEKGDWPKTKESDPLFREQLLRSTRSLWDKSYQDESWIGEKIYLIPRLRAMAARIKPSAKISIGEYNFRSERDPAGAIAQAEILGIMASEDLYSAQYWDFPIKDGTHRLAFLLYRNFDGEGAGFGERFVPNSVGIQKDRSVFVAEDKDQKRLTYVLLNKSLTETKGFEIIPEGQALPKSARLIAYQTNAKGDSLERVETVPLTSSKTLILKARPLSMQILELKY